MSAVSRDLTDAVAAVRELRVLDADPNGLIVRGPARALFDAVDEACAAGHRDEVEDLILKSSKAASELGQDVLAWALERVSDREFRGHGVDGLDVRRVDFLGPRVLVEDFNVELVATEAGVVVPKAGRDTENPLVTVVCELQLFVPNSDDEKAVEVHARGFDDYGLIWSEINLAYHLRQVRRIMWGYGCCMLSEQRAVGLIFSRDKPYGRPSVTPEREAMPDALIAGHAGKPAGSVVVFSAARSLFEERRVMAPLLARKLPEIYLFGDEVDLIISSIGVVDDSDSVTGPRKGQIAAAMEQFVPEGSVADKRPVGATRQCPWCSETIKADAQECRYCGRDVEPALPEEIEREEIEFVRDEFPAAFDRGFSMLVGLPHPPAHPARWLRELCKRIEAGSPPAAAAERIPLDWEGPAPRKPPSVAAAVGVGDPAAVGEFPDVAAEFPAAYDQARALLAGLEPPPDHPAAWLRELCQRIDAGSPPEAAAGRIPLDWR